MAHYSAIRYTADNNPAIPRAIAAIRWARTNLNLYKESGPSRRAIRYPDDKYFTIKKIK